MLFHEKRVQNLVTLNFYVFLSLLFCCYFVKHKNVINLTGYLFWLKFPFKTPILFTRRSNVPHET